MTLPPGQHAVDGFPRFGTHLHAPPPPVPDSPTLTVDGAVAAPITLPLAALADLPRREQVADFHCVAGWSATGLRWEGVPFAAFHRAIVEPALAPGTRITHVVFGGLDGFRSVATLADALGEDVLLAEHLDGQPLERDHGAPLRLVSPSQYGYVSTKHLCRIEVHAVDPRENFGAATRLSARLMIRPLFDRHPRGRVWEEERNGTLPNWLVRPVYRALTPPLRALSERGRRAR